MTTIKGYCRTNLDGYERESWPEHFVAVPRIGEWVASKSGKRLKVAQITYMYDWEGKRNFVPYIEVELTNHRNGATL